MFSASAASFTGELASSPPRPRGRSGCVTTPSILKSGCGIKCRKEGTANAGVPQNMIFSGTGFLPLAGFLHLADFSFDHVALQHAQVRDKQHAVQMIDLVAERPG